LEPEPLGRATALEIVLVLPALSRFGGKATRSSVGQTRFAAPGSATGATGSMRGSAAARRRTVQATDAERLTDASKHRHAHSWLSTFDLMRDDPRLIGDRIRERRRALGLSQRDLSQPGISYARNRALRRPASQGTAERCRSRPCWRARASEAQPGGELGGSVRRLTDKEKCTRRQLIPKLEQSRSVRAWSISVSSAAETRTATTLAAPLMTVGPPVAVRSKSANGSIGETFCTTSYRICGVVRSLSLSGRVPKFTAE
jgi:hypothetical protein